MAIGRFWMINKLKPKSEFSRNVLTLMTGTAIAQAIPLIFSPLLTRLYTPDQFGTLAFFISSYALLAILFTAKYEQAIMIPKGSIIPKYIFQSILLISGIFIVLSYLTLFFVRDFYYIENIDTLILFLLPLAAFLFVLNQALIQMINRKRKFKITAQGKVVLWSVITFAQIVLAISNIQNYGLIAGQIIGLLSVVVFLILKSKIKIGTISFSKMKWSIRKYINFPKFVMPNAFMNTLSINLPNILLGTFFGWQYAGFYLLATRIVSTPVSLVTTSISQVFYQKASELYAHKQNLKSLIFKTYLNQLKIGIIPIIMVSLMAPIVFKILFGEEWYQAGIYTRYLSPWLFMVFLNTPISSIVNITNRQKEYLIFEVLLLIARSTAFVVGKYYFDDALISIVLFAVVSFIFHIYLSYLFLYKLRRYYER